MNKLQLVEIIAKENDITKDMASKVVNSMIKHIMDAVKNGDMVLLIGFGTFRSIVRKERKVPFKNGNQPSMSKRKKIPKFVPGTLFKKLVNEPVGGETDQITDQK